MIRSVPPHRPLPRAGAITPSTGRPNTLGLTQRDLERLLDQIDAESTAGGPSTPGRQTIRRPFRHATIPMRITHSGGETSTFDVACSNISRTGLAALHRSYLHPQTRCAISLPLLQGGRLDVPGRIARCRHRRGLVHEIGIVFDQPVDVRDLMTLDAFSDWFSLEHVDPEKLTGRLLYIDDSAADRRLVCHHLAETHVIVVTAEDALSGLDKAQACFDLIICELSLPDMDGATLIEQLRSKGIDTPAILVTADTGDAVRDRLVGVRAQACLRKPVPQEQLLRAVAEFLLVAREGADAVDTTPGQQDPRTRLALEFLHDLKTIAAKLGEARQEQNFDACRRLCLQLKSAAAPLGFDAVAAQAVKTLSAITTPGGSAQGGAGDPSYEVERLIVTCQRAHVRRAA